MVLRRCILLNAVHDDGDTNADTYDDVAVGVAVGVFTVAVVAEKRCREDVSKRITLTWFFFILILPPALLLVVLMFMFKCIILFCGRTKNEERGPFLSDYVNVTMGLSTCTSIGHWLCLNVLID